MTEYDIFECDACGDRHGHKTEMVEVPLIQMSGRFEEPETLLTHLCIGCSTPPISSALEKVEAFGVDSFRGTVTAAVFPNGDAVPIPEMENEERHSDVVAAIPQIEERVM